MLFPPPEYARKFSREEILMMQSVYDAIFKLERVVEP
jgi:hypothetical protein